MTTRPDREEPKNPRDPEGKGEELRPGGAVPGGGDSSISPDHSISADDSSSREEAPSPDDSVERYPEVEEEILEYIARLDAERKGKTDRLSDLLPLPGPAPGAAGGPSAGGDVDPEPAGGPSAGGDVDPEPAGGPSAGGDVDPEPPGGPAAGKGPASSVHGASPSGPGGGGSPGSGAGRLLEARGAGRVIGDYRILREVGRGGMGVVYEAEQISLKRRVAFKILPPHLSFSKESVLKFQREAMAGGRQSHPGIVTVHAVGEEEGLHYIVQEFVEGGVTLADRLEESRKKGLEQPGGFREAAALAAEVAGALAHAHASGVIHRDVKPSNILITPEGRPKVTDFGLAKVEDALSLSRTGDFTGTPCYMSPEQAESRGKGIDHRADIFSLGVTLYEMLTLELPFDGETTQEVLKKILLEDPLDPRKRNPQVPRDLAVIVLKALEKEPKDRYAAMEEFAADLRRFLSGDVIMARPSGPARRFVKRVRRNPASSAAWGVSLAAVAVLALVLSFTEFGAFDEEEFLGFIEAGCEAHEGKTVVLEGLLRDLEGREEDITAKNKIRFVRLKNELRGAIRYARAAPALEALGRMEKRLGTIEGDRGGLEGALAEICGFEDLLPRPEWERASVLKGRIETALSTFYLEAFLDGPDDRGAVTERVLRGFAWCRDPALLEGAREKFARVLGPAGDGGGRERGLLAKRGFYFLGRESFSCGGVTKAADIYLHARTGLQFILVPGGSFLMGYSGGEERRKPWESPRHRVAVKPFLLCRTEVTQAAWLRVMGTAPWKEAEKAREGFDYPVVEVNWKESRAFCEAAGLRLPSEAEWEYACRAGTATPYFFGEAPEKLGDYAWYKGNVGDAGERYPHRTALKKPNAFGLFDMYGNAWEWCEDTKQGDYRGAPGDGSAWVVPGSLHRIIRGGAWFNDSRFCRSARRNWAMPSYRSVFLGFRPAADVTGGS